MAKAHKVQVTIPSVIHTVEPPAQSKIWMEERTRGEYVCGVTVCCGDSPAELEAGFQLATAYFMKIKAVVDGVRLNRERQSALPDPQ